MNTQPLIDEIRRQNRGDKTFIIAIDGRSGSGKSSLAEILTEFFENASIVHLDHFEMYDGKSSTQRIIREVLQPLKKLYKNRIVIIEGIFALASELIPYYDYKIWVDCPEKVGFERGLKRDINLNSIDNSDKWINYWLPKEREYINNEKPQTKANYIIDGTIKFK